MVSSVLGLGLSTSPRPPRVLQTHEGDVSEPELGLLDSSAEEAEVT